MIYILEIIYLVHLYLIYTVSLCSRRRATGFSSSQIGTFINKFHSHSFFLNHFRSKNNKKMSFGIDLDKLEALEMCRANPRVQNGTV